MSRDIIQEALLKANSRGYEIHSYTADKTQYNLINRVNDLHLTIWPSTDEFKLDNIHKMGIILTTSVCGSFMCDNHFNKFEAKMVIYNNALKNI